MAMSYRRNAAIVTVIMATLILSFVPSVPSASATSGTVVVHPGETVYVSFGDCSVGDLLLWSLSISTWSSVYSDALVDPGGLFLDIQDVAGRFAYASGEWRLAFGVAASGYWDATVTYTMYGVTPYISITSPHDGAFVVTSAPTITGTTEGFADRVQVSLDDVNYEQADLYMGSWSKQISLGPDGEYTIYTEERIVWGAYWFLSHDSVTIIKDTVFPDLVVLTPASNAFINGTVHLSCQYSDESGIADMETKIDSWSWQSASTLDQDLTLAEGAHTVQVRVTDLAGNPTINTVTFTVDRTPPQLTITSPLEGSHVTDISLAWQCSDSSGIVKEELSLDSTLWVPLTENPQPEDIVDGQHTLQVRVTDSAGNTAIAEVTVLIDTRAPGITISDPLANAKVCSDDVVVSWSGSDWVSGIDQIDHYEVQIDGGAWTEVGNATTYQVTNLADRWHSVTVKAVDRTGNYATSTVSFGIYTSIWSTNGPYQGIPLFGLIAGIILVAIVALLVMRKRKGGPTVSTVPKEEPVAQAP